MSTPLTDTAIDQSFDRIFSGLPTTWPTDPDDARQVIADVVRKHAEALAFLDEIAEPHGGGMIGAGLGMLGILERRHLITTADRERLKALFEAFRAHALDPVALLPKVQDLEDAANNDTHSTPLTLSILGVATSSLGPAATLVEKEPHAVGAAIAVGDAVGMGLGGAAGPLGAFLGGYAASITAGKIAVAVT